MIQAIDAVEKHGFAGAIGADDGKDLSFFHLETHPHEGLDASEGDGKILNSQLDFIAGGHSPLLLKVFQRVFLVLRQSFR